MDSRKKRSCQSSCLFLGVETHRRGHGVGKEILIIFFVQTEVCFGMVMGIGTVSKIKEGD